MTTILQDVDTLTGQSFTDGEIRNGIETAYRWANSQLGRTIALDAGDIPYVDTDAIASEDNEGLALADFVKLILENGRGSNKKTADGVEPVSKSLTQLFNESGLKAFLAQPTINTTNPGFKISNTRTKAHWRD